MEQIPGATTKSLSVRFIQGLSSGLPSKDKAFINRVINGELQADTGNEIESLRTTLKTLGDVIAELTHDRSDQYTRRYADCTRFLLYVKQYLEIINREHPNTILTDIKHEITTLEQEMKHLKKPEDIVEH